MGPHPNSLGEDAAGVRRAAPGRLLRLLLGCGLGRGAGGRCVWAQETNQFPVSHRSPVLFKQNKRIQHRF